jgi:hypothetical protein
MSTLRDLDLRLKAVEARNQMCSICAGYITRQMKMVHNRYDGWLDDMSQQIDSFEKECAEKMKK